MTRGPGVSQDVLVRPAFGESYIMFVLLHNIQVRSNFGKELRLVSTTSHSAPP